MTLTRTRVTAALLATAALGTAGGAAAELARPGAFGQELKLVVGWHDEMNDPKTWQLLQAGVEPGLFSALPGALTLRLPQAPEGFPHPYQWGGVTQRADVDLGRYPVLAAFVRRVQEGSYAHLDVEEQDHAGRPARSLRTPTVRGFGLSVLDVGKEWGPQTRRLHLRLIVGGPLTGATCEYSWVRFVRREDVPRLQAFLLPGDRTDPILDAPTRVQLRP